jgi:hypothetical protein
MRQCVTCCIRFQHSLAMHMSTTSFKLTSEFGADSFCCCGDAWLGFRGDKEVFCKKRGKYHAYDF